MSGERPGEAALRGKDALAELLDAHKIEDEMDEQTGHWYHCCTECDDSGDGDDWLCFIREAVEAVRAEERERIVVNLAEAVQALEFGAVDAATSALTGHNSLGCACLRCDNVRAVLAPLAAKLARQEASR